MGATDSSIYILNAPSPNPLPRGEGDWKTGLPKFWVKLTMTLGGP